MTQEKVSIIMPCFNSEQFIERSIKSVLAQNYQNWELLITDDGSTDSSPQICLEYLKKDSRIKLFKNKFTKGASGARNTSIDEAKGRFIAFLDSDDIWYDFYLKDRLEQLLNNEYAFTYSWYEKVDENFNKIGFNKTKKKSISYKELLTDCVIGTLTAIYDTKKLGKVYFPYIDKRQDFALWLKILKKVNRAYLYPKVCAKYTVRKNSISSNKFNLVKYNYAIYRRIQGFNIFKSLYYFSIFIFKYFIKKLFS